MVFTFENQFTIVFVSTFLLLPLRHLDLHHRIPHEVLPPIRVRLPAVIDQVLLTPLHVGQIPDTLEQPTPHACHDQAIRLRRVERGEPLLRGSLSVEVQPLSTFVRDPEERFDLHHRCVDGSEHCEEAGECDVGHGRLVFGAEDRPQDVDGVLHCLELALALSDEPAEEGLGSNGGD